MSGKKGSKHKGWENRSHIVECVAAYDQFHGNCKRAARHLIMPHQYLKWIWNRAGLKPIGTSKEPIKPNPELQKRLHVHGNMSKAAREVGINRNRAMRIANRFGYMKEANEHT